MNKSSLSLSPACKCHTFSRFGKLRDVLSLNLLNKMNTETDNIMWDCNGPVYPSAPETVKEPISREQALRNLPVNDDGENFAGEMLADVERLNAIRRREDAGVSLELANNPWLTKELIVSYLERSEKILLDAGFVL